MTPSAPSEHFEQTTVVTWCERRGHVLFAVPNGGKRGLREAVKLKREGVRKGAPDLVLITLSPVNNKPTMIEMKSKSGRYSPEQLSMHQLALRSGWNVLAPPRNESARWVICQLELLGY